MSQSLMGSIDMTRNGPSVPLYRPPSKGAVPYEEWTDDASCRGLPTELFELGGPEESEDRQHTLIAEGLKVCAGCPARQSCLVNSNELDRYWTTRGGQPPEGLFPDANEPDFQGVRMRGARVGSIARKPKVECKRGHRDWVTDKRGKRYCATCKKEDNKKRWELRKVG